jgi:hypothetical protein
MLDRLNFPRRLSSRLWLLALPSALTSFERRQNIPKLPIGAFRYGGVPLIIAGLAIGLWSWRNPGTTIQVGGPAQRLANQPATIAGLLIIAGAGVLLRSPVLLLYSLGITAAAATDKIDVDEPSPDDFLGGSFIG